MSNKPYTTIVQKNTQTLTDDLPRILKPIPHNSLTDNPPTISTPSQGEVDDIINRAWDAIAQNLPPYRIPDPETLDKITASIYKLKSCSNNSKCTSIKEEELLIKKQELLIKQEIHNDKKATQDLAIQKSKNNRKGLTPEELLFIEEECNLR